MRESIPNKNSDLERFRPFLNVDIIVSDIDGTLVGANGDTLGQVRSIIHSLGSGKKKIFFSIATGRTYYGVKELLEKLNLKKGIPIALYNGGVILEYGTSNILSVNSIERNDCILLCNMLYKLNVNAYLYTFNISQSPFGADYKDRIEEIVYGIGNASRGHDVNGIEIQWLENVEEVKGEINAVLIEKGGLTNSEILQIKIMLDGMSDINYTDSGSGYLELRQRGVDKGLVINELRKFVMETKPDKTMLVDVLAIGDNDNDLELFQKADISVAVANASKLAIDEADYTCERESAEGFLDMLNAIKIARKYYGEENV